MDEKYTTEHVANLYGVTRETVRQWSEEFERHLSPTANPGYRRQRLFTDDDMRVFDYIAGQKKQGAINEDIHNDLDAQQRGASPAASPGELSMTISQTDRKTLITQISDLQRTIDRLEDEIKELQEVKLDVARLEGELKSETRRADRAEDRNVELQTEMAVQRERMGQVRGELLYLKRRLAELEGKPQPPNDEE